MKPVFASNRVLKAISATATVVLLIASNPMTTHANPIKGKATNRVSENQLSVQYSGTDADSYVFRVAFDNPTTQKFSLIIKNDEGLTVYQEQYTDTHFAKIVRLPKEEVDIHPTFIIHTSNGDVKQRFSVSRKITEDLVVTKS
jgi:hypothetical protein